MRAVGYRQPLPIDHPLWAAPNIWIRAEWERNGYIVKNTETHFGQFPHQESERFRLQLLKASKKSGKFENSFPI